MSSTAGRGGRSTVLPALGAAYAAGLAAGLWPDLETLRANWGVDRVFEPQWDEARREEQYAGWKRAVERTRGWVA